MPAARGRRVRCRVSPAWRGVLGAVLWACLCAAPAPAADNAPAAPDAKLERLKEQIRALRDQLNTARTQQDELRNGLRAADTRIGALAAHLQEIAAQIQTHNRRLDGLGGERRRLLHDLDTQRRTLDQQIRASYAVGRQEYLKLLLNQQDPAAVARTLTYYDYFNKARLARIGAIDSGLKRVARLEDEIRSQTTELETARRTQAEEHARLETTRSERRVVLANLESQVREKNQQLQMLMDDARRLERLVQDLPSAAPPLEPDIARNRDPFAKLRGKLRWPAAGRLSAQFGTSRGLGTLKWQGVLIAANEGSEVRTVSHGRVVFADWLRGFGMLLIVDHGDGYMSLYGHNQSLYKEVGDWIEAGEVVASVGDSGGRAQTGLYFEIRHKGEPVNPKNWCKSPPAKIGSARFR